MIVAFPAIVVKVNMAELSGFEECFEIVIDVSMTDIESKTQSAPGQFRQECGGTEVAALPRPHVLDTERDTVLLLEIHEIIERTEKCGVRTVPDLWIGSKSGMYHYPLCIDCSTDGHEITKGIHRGSPHPIINSGKIDLSSWCMHGVREWILIAGAAVYEEIVQPV
jgi:hypothetical protein